MKYSLLAAFSLCLTNLISFGQSNEMNKPTMVKMADTPIKERFSVSPSIGWLHAWGDFKKDGFFPSFLESDANQLGYGILLNYKLSNVFSLSGGVLFGKLEGTLDDVNTVNAVNSSVDYGTGIEFRTDLFELTLPRINANITRAIFKDRSAFFNKASVGLFLSHGLVYYDSKIYPQSGDDVNLLYSKERGRTGKTTEAVTSFGGSITYNVSNKIDVGLESSIRFVNNDKLDAWIAGDFNDQYSYTAVSVTYHFRSNKDKKKPVKPVKEVLANKEDVKELEETPKKEEMAEEIEEKKEVMEDKIEEVVTEKLEAVIDSPKVEEKKEEVIQKEEPKTTNVDKKVITGYRYYVVVAAFKGQTSTDLLMTRLKKKGENPSVIRNLEDTWNLITIAEYDNKATALKEMKKARKRGLKQAWVHILPPTK